MKMDLCVIITAGDGRVIITAMMAWMYTVRRLKEVFEVVSDIVFADTSVLIYFEYN